MSTNRLCTLAVCAALAFSGSLFAAEQVDNPAYQAWAKHKPGTSVTYKSTMEMKMPEGSNMPGRTMTSTTTQTLKEVRPDGVTIEIKSENSMMPGRGMTNTHTIPAKIDADKKDTGELPPNVKGEIKDLKKGEEKVEVGGKTYNAKTREMTIAMTQPQQMESHVKIWQTEDVPGGMVKMEQSTTTPMETHHTTTLESYTEGK